MLFCIVVAIGAAALADPLVEFLSNAGLFGRCNCTDHSNLDVIPALCVGLALGAGLLALRVRYLLARGAIAAPATWLASGAIERPGVLVRCLPAIVAIQLVALYAMETAEQVIVTGHSLGGTIWLGGPIAISLGIHAASAIVATFAIARALRASTTTAIRILLRLVIAMSARGPRRTPARLRYPASFRRLAPLVCRMGERGPPFTA